MDLNTQKQVKLWDWAARILPMLTLIAIFICHYLELDDLRNKIINLSLVVFCLTAIIWWWWAIYKISWLANLYSSLAERLKEVRTGAKEIKKDLKE